MINQYIYIYIHLSNKENIIELFLIAFDIFKKIWRTIYLDDKSLNCFFLNPVVRCSDNEQRVVSIGVLGTSLP